MTNPLRTAGKPDRIFDLDDFCHASNQFNWVKSSGRLYFITTKRDDQGNVVHDEKTGKPIRYLDRNA